MASPYVFTGPAHVQTPLAALPAQVTTSKGLAVTIERSAEADLPQARTILNIAIEEGISYPFESQLDEASFKAYFCSHDSFVARLQSDPTVVVGIFYIKPNFPGRCSSYCNGGFAVAPDYRRQGIARVMARAFITLAAALGYRASMFNLVFVANEASIKLWDSLGFERLSILPGVGRLKGHEKPVDAQQYMYDLTKVSVTDRIEW